MTYFFDSAFKELMYWEGGGKFHQIPGDAGGATKYGISLRFIKNLPLDESDINHDGHVTDSDIESLNEATAKAFYRKHFWLHYQLGNIEQEQVATKILSIYVNMRGRVAGRVVQRALASCRIDDVKEDGYVGPLTQSAINEITCDLSLTAMFLAALRAQQESIYRLIVANNPSQRKFLNGWLRRARDKRA